MIASSWRAHSGNFPELPREGLDLDKLLESVEQRYLGEGLHRVAGNKTEAAKLRGITFRSIRYRLQKLGMED